MDKIIEASSFSSTDSWVVTIVNEYYDNPEWFELIGISKAKRIINDSGKPKSLNYIKAMIDRFLDYFGLESKQSKRSNGSRSYVVITPSEVKDYLRDIDSALDRRAKKIIEEMHEVSLKGIVDQVEEMQQQKRSSREQQDELNLRMLASQLTNTANLDNIPIATIKLEWVLPESIAEVAKMLECCEDPEELALIRQCDIPPEVFKIAARQLPNEKREQIKQWVIQLNSA